MDRKLAISGAAALPAAALLAVVGGYALGYAHGHQDALGAVWNLRSVAQCLDPSVPANVDPTEEWEEPFPHSRWFWKNGPRAGGPVERWEHGTANPFEGAPLLGTVGERLAARFRVDVANWRPPSY